MRITNTIGWETPWLRKLIGFCCRELEYPVSSLEGATFRLAHNMQYRGVANLDSHSIRVKINPLNVYPLWAPWQRGLPELMLADAVEVLVEITAHEVAHLERWDRFAREWKRLGKRDSALWNETPSAWPGGYWPPSGATAGGCSTPGATLVRGRFVRP